MVGFVYRLGAICIAYLGIASYTWPHEYKITFLAFFIHNAELENFRVCTMLLLDNDGSTSEPE